MTTRQLSRLFHEAAETVGIKKSVTLSALRHSSGSRIIPATDGRRTYFPGDLAISDALMAA
jgi:hypothetical protein